VRIPIRFFSPIGFCQEINKSIFREKLRIMPEN
jgi:hypothetical protein